MLPLDHPDRANIMHQRRRHKQPPTAGQHQAKLTEPRRTLTRRETVNSKLNGCP